MNDFEGNRTSRSGAPEQIAAPDVDNYRPGANNKFMPEMVKQAEALSEANMLSRAIIDHLSHALVVVDRSMRVIHTNLRFRSLFSVNEDVAQMGITIGKVMDDESLTGIIQHCVKSGDPLREMEYTCSARVGEEARQFLLDISLFVIPSNKERILLSFDEITEWKQRQNQVTEASRLVSIGEMAAGIAHEINNPLAAVMGFAQLAMRRNVDDSIRRDLDKILAESKRASKIIANLQSFARRYKPRQEPVNVIEILQKVLEFRSYESQVSNIAVAMKFDPRTPLVMGDEHQLDQVFLNIVINAEHMMFITNGGGNLNIEVGLRDDKVFISFEDDGPGIEPDVLPKIFDPFFTTKEVGKGTGLGLSICYGIVHEHGGIIRVSGTPGNGATFVVELPAPEVEPGEESAAKDNTPETDNACRPLNVLIVDDEPLVVEFLSRVLTEFGHTVAMAENGNSVMEMTDLDKYDLIMLDVRMPGVGSETLFDHIRGVSNDISNRILYITGDATNPDTRAFIAATGSPVLTKPFTIEDLLTAVRRIAGKNPPS
ncbi:MAG: response regulator [Chloroflexi bacterium]|nr:response regulator [Chloroflexota bacterium]